MRAARSAGALIVVCLLVAGVPWALNRFGSAGQLLEVDWTAVLTSPVGSDLLLAILSGVGWLAWAFITVAIALEFLAVASRRRIHLRLPGTGWLRPLVGAIVVAAATAPSLASADTAAPPPGSVTEPTRPTAGQDPPVAIRDSPDGRGYVVQPGDELWDIAERELGSGERWREIVALNPAVDDSLKVTAGQELRLPEAAEMRVTDEVAVVVVQPGDSLWAIAQRVLGDGARWPEIHELNRNRIADPDEIDIGWVLSLPATQSSAPDVPPSPDPTPQNLPQPGLPTPEATAALPTGTPPIPPISPEAVEPSLPATASPSAAPGGAPPTAERPPDGATEDGAIPLGVVGPIAALLAAGVVAGLATRRRAQLLGRVVGRRMLPVEPPVAHFWGALARHAASARNDEDSRTPTTVLLGWDPGGGPVWFDLEPARVTVLTGAGADGALAAILSSLSCSPWSEPVELVVVGDGEWAEALDDPRITTLPSTADGLTALAQLCATRRLELRQGTLAERRADPDRAVAWRPTVFLFERPPSPAQFDAVGDSMALGEVGVSVVATADAPPHIQHEPIALLPGEGRQGGVNFTPQLVGAPARRMLVDLFRTAATTETLPAPWWAEDGTQPSNVLPLPRTETHGEEHDMPEPPDHKDHPTLLLLGEVELLAPAGATPTRAVAQCMEYCAWLLSHPGATPTTMSHDLLVAETTRRSNMSRLRTWLGSAPDGSSYLPDAYTGRIRLDARVSSDWERFCALLSGGVNVSSSAALRQALRLVRGTPLGSFGFQWIWAETLRSDMVAMIVDAATVLADRAITHEDLDLALWAIGRGRLAAPDDDQLAVRAIHAYALAGRITDLDEAVLTLNRTVRAAGRDLDPALARRVQLAIHLSSHGVAADAE